MTDQLEPIISDPAIMGGIPIVKGTRLPARMLHARITGGDAIETVIEDYPYLDRETIEAAVLYVEAHPEPRQPTASADDSATGRSRPAKAG